MPLSTTTPASPKRHLTLIENPAEPRKLLRVGDIAKASGKTVRAIHLYEEMGLLEAAGRSRGQYRLFDADAVVRVRWISKLQSLGLSLPEIRDIVTQREASPSAARAAEELRAVYEERLREVRQKIEELRSLEAELDASVAYLATCKAACETTMETACCSSCSVNPEHEGAPDLVAGAHLS